MRAGLFLAACLLVVIVAVWFPVPAASGGSQGPVIADTNPPSGEALYPLPGSWAASGYFSIGVRFLDTDGISVPSLSMYVDGAVVTPVSWNNPVAWGTMSSLPDGPHTAEARASDMAGNGPTIVSWSFSVDSVFPVLSISNPTGNPKLVDGSVTLAWTGSDALSGIDHYEVRLDSGWNIDVGTATSLAFPSLAPGVHYFQVTAYDLAHNYMYKTAMATVPFPPPGPAGNTTNQVTVVVPDQIPAWAIALVVINAGEAAAVVWLAVRRRSEAPLREKPAP